MTPPAAARPASEPRALAHVRCVSVGTRNAAKLAAVRAAFAAYRPDVEVTGVEVDSGVPEQPVGYAEIAGGARARARAAQVACAGDLAVGYEDGLLRLEDVAEESALGEATAGLIVNVGCAVVWDGERESLGFSSGFAYPPDCAQTALDERAPIGDLFDRSWRAYARGGPFSGPSGASEGNIGKLSLGVLLRSEYARHAVLCALVRFLHPALYGDDAAAARRVRE